MAQNQINYAKMLPKKREAQLPAMEVDCDIEIGDNYRFQFEKSDPDNIVIMKGDEEEKVKLTEMKLRIIMCKKAQPSYYDGDKYVKDSTMQEAKGEESYICVALLEYDGNYTFGTLMLRKSLTRIAAYYNRKLQEVMTQLNDAGQIQLASEVYLFIPFQPVFKKILTKNGSYLRVTGMNFLPPAKAEIAACEKAIVEFREDYEATLKAAQYWLEPNERRE